MLFLELLYGLAVVLTVVDCFVAPYGSHPADYATATIKILR